MAVLPNYTDVKYAAIAASASGNNTLVAAVAGKRIRVLALSLSFAGIVNAKFQTAAGGTDLTGLYYGVANTQVVLPFNEAGHFQTVGGELLNMNLSAAIAVGGHIVYAAI